MFGKPEYSILIKISKQLTESQECQEKHDGSNYDKRQSPACTLR